MVHFQDPTFVDPYPKTQEGYFNEIGKNFPDWDVDSHDQRCAICKDPMRLGPYKSYADAVTNGSERAIIIHCGHKHIVGEWCLREWLKQQDNCVFCRKTLFRWGTQEPKLVPMASIEEEVEVEDTAVSDYAVLSSLAINIDDHIEALDALEYAELDGYLITRGGASLSTHHATMKVLNPHLCSLIQECWFRGSDYRRGELVDDVDYATYKRRFSLPGDLCCTNYTTPSSIFANVWSWYVRTLTIPSIAGDDSGPIGIQNHALVPFFIFAALDFKHDWPAVEANLVTALKKAFDGVAIRKSWQSESLAAFRQDLVVVFLMAARGQSLYDMVQAVKGAAGSGREAECDRSWAKQVEVADIPGVVW